MAFHFSPVLSTPTNSKTPCRTLVLRYTDLGTRDRFDFEFPGDGTVTGTQLSGINCFRKTGQPSEKLPVDDPLAYMKFLYAWGLASAHDLAVETAGVK